MAMTQTQGRLARKCYREVTLCKRFHISTKVNILRTHTSLFLLWSDVLGAHGRVENGLAESVSPCSLVIPSHIHAVRALAPVRLTRDPVRERAYQGVVLHPPVNDMILVRILEGR